jgi:hypothetical protein
MTMRMIVALITVVFVAGLLGLGVVGLVIHQPILAVVCALLAVFFSTFVVKDYTFFFGKKK